MMYSSQICCLMQTSHWTQWMLAEIVEGLRLRQIDLLQLETEKEPSQIYYRTEDFELLGQVFQII